MRPLGWLALQTSTWRLPPSLCWVRSVTPALPRLSRLSTRHWSQHKSYVLYAKHQDRQIIVTHCCWLPGVCDFTSVHGDKSHRAESTAAGQLPALRRLATPRRSLPGRPRPLDLAITRLPGQSAHSGILTAVGYLRASRQPPSAGMTCPQENRCSYRLLDCAHASLYCLCVAVRRVVWVLARSGAALLAWRSLVIHSDPRHRWRAALNWHPEAVRLTRPLPLWWRS